MCLVRREEAFPGNGKNDANLAVARASSQVKRMLDRRAYARKGKYLYLYSVCVYTNCIVYTLWRYKDEN